MKVILVDDEPAMHLIMRRMLNKLSGVEVSAAFTDTGSAAAYLREHHDIALAFVDISMPDEDGISFAARGGSGEFNAQIVFVTSHKDYALQAYELSVIDYLVKPVSQERLERTVNRMLAGRQALPQSGLQKSEGNTAAAAVTMLGDVFVQSGAGRVKWISRKSAELFAYLLLYKGKRVPRTRLLEDIFGGMTQVNAENYLNTSVYQLRKSLEPLQLREAVHSINDGYMLELEDAVIDYEEFLSRVEQMRHIDPTNIEEAQHIERMYTGELFGDRAYVWAIMETERLARLYTAFALRLAETMLNVKDLAGALKLLLKLHGRNPLEESAIRLLMQGYVLAADKKALTAQYTRYVRLLSKELGIKPSQELVTYYYALLSGLENK
ncbi:response regulator [Paenibacillus sp. GCM10012307]|uniref:Response regulator n=1 Tax=Paenibacillus roseus TaxID=2798579 RepID=A0A934MMA7_9BACL|nr:response regulator [Paenibacillus roseus]MBJ6359741.1 response regulator [Paenibacillus roseus]